MELFESDYWKVTIFLQKFVGIWVFQTKWKRYVSLVYVYSFTISFSISMGIRLYNEIGVNLNIVVENFIGELYLSIIFFKITMSIIVRKRLMILLSDIARDWKEKFLDPEDLKIMHHYTELGRQSVMLYSSFMIASVAIFLTFPVSSPILDVIVPLENGTRLRNLPYYAEYGIDIQEHYYPLLGQAVFGGIGTVVVLVSFDLCFILIVQHVIGLFALVNHRFNKVAALSEKIEDGFVPREEADRLSYHLTVSAIELHTTVMKYIDLIEESYNFSWLGVLFQNMVMLGGGLATTVMKLDQPIEMFRYLAVMCAILIHFYYVFLPGQKIIDSSEEVFETCYACKWYNLSLKTNSLVKIVMIRSLRRCELTGGKMFTLSMDTYCNMMKTGLSVFTVLNS
ncbi:uncharacterized protein LOC106644749 [Copidosoma floridanum]|uniref:uncharacterized protein LOC106644749 n=1 Tax=Copidosoma floridanum TaxID=29053 RepID=UPI0006C9AA00|nr:uncharacterized protein LOC106644749 [Copidosoma floridanum]